VGDAIKPKPPLSLDKNKPPSLIKRFKGANIDGWINKPFATRAAVLTIH